MVVYWQKIITCKKIILPMQFFSNILFFLYSGRQSFENSLHGKQLKIAPKRVSLWESAVKVAEKAKPMNRHERQLCYTFKYYDKNEAKRIDPLKLKKLNGFSSMPAVASLPEQVNGVADSREHRTCDPSNGEDQASELKAVNGVGSCNGSLKPSQKKNVKERMQRKRKLSASTVATKSAPNHVEGSKISEPLKKRKKSAIKQGKELNCSVDSVTDSVTDKIDIPIKLSLSDKLNTDLHQKCNGLCSNPSATPPRLNGDVSAFGATIEVSPNTALKLKIRKITPKQNPAEGKRKRGRPRKPQFVIVSESDSEKEGTNHLLSPNSAESEQISNSGKESMPLSKESSVEEMPMKKKRIRKPTSKMLSAKEVLKQEKKVQPKRKTVKKSEEKTEPEIKQLESSEEKIAPKTKKVKNVVEKKDEPSVSEPNGAVETEGSVASSSDDTGSVKNGAAAKKEKDGVCIVCEQQENLTFCEGVCGNAFHLDCIGLSVVPKGKFVCDECVTGNHCCFVCRQAGNVKQCSQPLCTKHYHDECIQTFKTAKFDGDRFYCPLHFCSTCVSNKSVVSRGRMIRCVRCPTAYHISGCLVAGCIPICSSLMVCSKHFLREKHKAHHTHVNVNWCFVCSIGGTLICCESCPAAFHPECISYEGIPEGHFFCKDCTEGKQLLYGDIVWVKLGMYR